MHVYLSALRMSLLNWLGNVFDHNQYGVFAFSYEVGGGRGLIAASRPEPYWLKPMWSPRQAFPPAPPLGWSFGPSICNRVQFAC